MLKKLFYAVVGTSLALTILFGRDTASYVATTAGWVKSSVKDSVPIELEMERARKMIAALTPEIKENMHLIAKEEVEVDRLGRQVDKLTARVTKDRRELARLNDHLETGTILVSYNGRKYGETQIKVDLANRLKRLQTNDSTLTNMQTVHDARSRGLEAARLKLEEMMAAKRNLAVKVEQLEARRKMVEVASSSCKFSFDDSHLTRTNDMLQELETKIEVAERMIDVESDYFDQIPVDVDIDDNITEQVTAYLDSLAPPAEFVAEVDSDFETLD